MVHIQNQWNRIKSPATNLNINGQQIFDEGAKNTQWRRGSLLNKRYWNNVIFTCKRMQLDPYLIRLTKFCSKCIKDLNVTSETMKLLKENMGT